MLGMGTKKRPQKLYVLADASDSLQELLKHCHVSFDVALVNEDVTDFEGFFRSLGCFGLVVGAEIVNQSAGNRAVFNVFSKIVAANTAAQKEENRSVFG